MPVEPQLNRQQTKAGFVAFIGLANAGKSTLVNRIVGSKIAIVTHKVQTTRTPLRGITTVGNSQVVVIDTPGLFSARDRFDQVMVNSAWRQAASADLALLLIDARRGITAGVEHILQALSTQQKQPIVSLVINKIDQVQVDSLLALSRNLNDRFNFAKTFMISAKKGHGVQALRQYLGTMMPFGVWLYPEQQIADAQSQVIAAEITREKLTLRLHDEIPYQSTVVPSVWRRSKQNRLYIEQTIYVVTKRHRPIVLGAMGQTIKAIGQARPRGHSKFLRMLR